ncbi:T9SS type B sorting domain-containing protein [Flavobacterium difficile]|uniref:T9SS type B sorting domain-containing protein n=1 Tax=Flavobacterium difficile TaxID=2709659 RepID=UPI00293BF5BB|nr:T9SS type B sorting domain-containing protein [Flavobacterium difficile]
MYATTSVGSINWFATATSTTILASGASFITPILSANTTFYFEATNSGCVSNRMAVTVPVNPIPIVTDENLVICQNTNITLQAGVSSATYLWSTGVTSPSIVVSNPGNYSVWITTAQNCTVTKNFTVIEYTQPEITEVKVTDLTAEIMISGTGVFEYSIDNINFQSSPVFNFAVGGVYTCYVRETGNNCGFDIKVFVVIEYPKFFTPNGDGINDFWEIKGIGFVAQPVVSIFDRYGKLITVLNQRKRYWDGKFNSEMLPETDYWFVANLGDGFPEYKGHFTLKR